MSVKHPIISVTGSSGAGTTSVRKTFEIIFRREDDRSCLCRGRFVSIATTAMRCARKWPRRRSGATNTSAISRPNRTFSIGSRPCSREFGATGKGLARHYIHDDEEATLYGGKPGAFTPWEPLPPADLLLYEGLHGAVVADGVDVARHADVKIGVVPVINLEWIQKLHRDRSARGYSTEAVTDTILRRMPDYVNYICPQFTLTDINFQRVPTVDTSNPFVARWIPTADESMVVIRFKNPRGIDFPYLLSMIAGSFMSRANSIVIHGGKLDLAMQLILTPMILKLIDQKRRAL